jgi:hypothetical protein
MHAETARLVESLTNEPRYAKSAAGVLKRRLARPRRKR